MATSNPSVKRQLRQAYQQMHRAHGHQQWWPADSPFEICVGAILTQNTSWKNVEHAIANLKAAKALSVKRMYDLPVDKLAKLIRPAGYYNMKAARLRNFLSVLMDQYNGSLRRMLAGNTETVRARLLAINGIGPETADSMLLYAGGHASFVIDAYTKRIFSRHDWCKETDDYDALQTLCQAALGQRTGAARTDYWQDYHAQLVVVGNRHCRPKNPHCDECPLQSLLPT